MSDYYSMETQAHEWILSSQNGSYAIGTGNLLNQRKYNGILIKSDQSFQRTMLVSSIEEEVKWRGESFYLDSTSYSNCIYPEGFLHLVKSWLRPFPVFLYSSLPHNDDILIKKELKMDKDTSTIFVKYTNLGSHTLHFKIRPKYAMRNHHHLNEQGIFDKITVHADFKTQDNQVNTSFSVHRADTDIKVFGWLLHGRSFHDKVIFRNVFYPWEAYRGYPATEDLISPLYFEFELKINESNYIVFSDKDITSPLTTIDEIEKRYHKLPTPYDIPTKRKRANSEESLFLSIDFNDKILFKHNEYLQILEQSMKDFLANNDIVAGFPWFGAWGRDTMIALEGALKLPKGGEIAYSILKKYASQMKNGLIPNMCSESLQQMNYHSIDATLWFVLRLYDVCDVLDKRSSESDKTKAERWKDVIKITEQIFDRILGSREYPPKDTNTEPYSHEKQTTSKLSSVNAACKGQCVPSKDFFIRYDGLLELKENFASATWMDAKVYGHSVTPRTGAPVEINALLYNAICSYEKMIDEHNDLVSDKENILINQTYLEAGFFVQESFHKFWIEGYLADRLIGDEPIKECRPNALIAASLPFSDKLLSIEQMRQIYETAHVELFTPYGIRSLSPKDPKFMKKYIGSVEERDKAYHQGTVWAWLLLPFVKTWLWAYPNKTTLESVNHISYLIEKLRNGYVRGHIASIAEVWDGDKPHFPKGCPAQAWSVSALYCTEILLLELQETASITSKGGS